MIAPETNQLDLSRPVAAADSLGDKAPERHRFTTKKVLITGETEILNTQNGKTCLLAAIRLVSKMVRGVSIFLPEGSPLEGEVSQLLTNISHGEQPPIILKGTDFTCFDAILSVGTDGRPDLPWTTINSNGFTARVSSGSTSLLRDCSQPNPIGALAAASLGAAEIFKRLIKLVPERGELFDGLYFSLYSYEVKEDPGPPLPDCIPIDLLLVGIGAIGNGVLCLLDALPISGRAVFVDKQAFAEENLGTCIMIGPKDIGSPKARFAETLLGEKLECVGFPQDIIEFNATTVKGLPYPKIIISALDQIEPRHAVQSLWPNLVIDGAIGTFACEATLHPWPEDLSCLYCDFERPPKCSEKLESELTGLTEERLRETTSRITEDDVRTAPVAKRQWLRKQIGKEICSVVSEATIEKLSRELQQKEFEPSVPFVACLSSCIIVTELIRHTLQWPRVLETGFQFDVLVGPQRGIRKAHLRKRSCICVQRNHIINALRVKHGLEPIGPVSGPAKLDS
jgi:molybdopterin/thiamine biosynthesis adenylyltransferase